MIFTDDFMHSAEFSLPDLEILFEDLAHPNPYIQSQSCLAMAKYWPNESLPRLLNLLDQENVALRRSAVRALGCFGISVLVPIAQKFDESEDGTVRASCIKAYAQVASNSPPGLVFPLKAMAILESALIDKSPVVSLAAVMALGQVGFQSLDLLLNVAVGENPALAVAAVNALAEIDDGRVEECFAKLLENQSTDSYVSSTVTSASERARGLRSGKKNLST